MVRIVDWAASHARMVIVCMILSIGAGVSAYFGLPKEGSPDIDFPGYFIAVPYPGISAQDSEQLLVKPLESRLRNLDGLEFIQATASEGYAGVFLQLEFGLDSAQTLADIRDKVSQAEAEFPEDAKEPTISEFSFADFPIIIVVLSGDLPERTLQLVAEDLRDEIESLPGILEVGLTGQRSEMIEVIIDPLQLEAYNVSGNELIQVVTRNNQLIAAGEVETASGAFAVKLPSSFHDPSEVSSLPIKTNGDRIVTLGDLADIRMTFQDRSGVARYNGETTIALQVVKRRGFNVIDTAAEVREKVEELKQSWPAPLKSALRVDFAQDMSNSVQSMVSQLESSVLTAICLVMIVVLASLGIRSSLLVGFAIPSSFLLCFTFLAILDIAISNIVMFGLILSVGMLVDSAIVIVELADRKITEGTGPMRAYIESAKRMFWPIVSSTATTICAFLPMLFWPGMPGQFMGTLPITLIFVLSASLLVAMVFLPVVGGVVGRIGMVLKAISESLRKLPWLLRACLAILFATVLFGSALFILNPAILLGATSVYTPLISSLPGALLFVVASLGLSTSFRSLSFRRLVNPVKVGRGRTLFGRVIGLIVGNPVMPIVVVVCTVAFVISTFQAFTAGSLGVEFFVDAEPERAKIYVLARGNLSLEEKDKLVTSIEELALDSEGASSIFSFTGEGGLRDMSGGGPLDAIGQIQLEFDVWEDRQLIGGIATDSRRIVEELEAKLKDIDGIKTDIQTESGGPQGGKPVSLRLTSNNWEELLKSAGTVRDRFETTKGLVFIDDTLPLPGIDWQVDVDVEKAVRFGADVSTVGSMVQLVTRGILIDTLRTGLSDEEIEIRVRFPESDRLLSTLSELRIRTPSGLVPLSNFITIRPVRQVSEIQRYNQKRFVTINADVTTDLWNEQGRPINPTERIELLTDWIVNEANLHPDVSWEWTGDQEEQRESQTFLMYAFAGALGLMFAVLLAQFNSLYNAVLVLCAVVLSTTGVLIGMLVMNQPFSIIMTGTGIVALAGIVVNNNIVLIDTYMEYARYMSRLEAIIRTAEVRIRPVLLTTITTMAGLTPMMMGWSIDLIHGGYAVDTPSAQWWKPLATAVVFGLGTATLLTLVLTPSLLAIRVWFSRGAYRTFNMLASFALGKNSQLALDRRLRISASEVRDVTVSWDQFQHVLLPVYPAKEEITLQQSTIPPVMGPVDADAETEDHEISVPQIDTEDTLQDPDQSEKQ